MSSSAVLGRASAADRDGPIRRVAVIGHTGRGNYGHGLDTVWLELPGVEVVAVADPDAEGLAKAVKRLKGARGFSDYRQMLAEARPEFVSVCPRHSDQHAAMALAAIEAGSRGIYVEKPFCRTPVEADRMVQACADTGARIAVAHRNRYHPVLQVIDDLISGGKLGRLLEIRGRGKGDRRGGGGDLWGLGCHVMNLVCYFAGDPRSCSATMWQDGRKVTRADVAEGAEGLGPLAANEVHARYEMEKGVVATFDSIANDGTGGHGFGLQLVGSGGVVHLRCDRDPVAHLVPGNPFEPTGKPRPWVPITTAGVGVEENQPEVVREVQNHVAAVRDLVEASDAGREPLCGVRDGALTVEMICGVFESHRQGGAAVEFPLAERGNPLAKW
jgi:predicted dehydrogenase